MEKRDITNIKVFGKSIIEGMIITTIFTFFIFIILFVYAFTKETSITLPFDIVKIQGGNIGGMTGLEVLVNNNFYLWISVIIFIVSLFIFVIRYSKLPKGRR